MQTLLYAAHKPETWNGHRATDGTETSNEDEPLTTAQQLGSLIKSARDIMRKDKGLTGDLDRLPMLTWIMFLKFLDDMEQIEEAKPSSGREEVPPRHRAALPLAGLGRQGRTASPATNCSPSSTRTKPSGPTATRGRACSPTCDRSQARNGGDRRDVIATVFNGVVNRMINGYLLRDVINKVDGIHFTSTEEIHTLGHLYESMLKEMRDAAGDSGEFYTPRPVVRFMVEVIDPQLGRDRPRPRLRHRRLPGRGLSTIWRSSARPSRTASRSRSKASSAARPSRCPTCWPR